MFDLVADDAANGCTAYGSDRAAAGKNGAAARLGMNRSTLQFRMRKLGLVRPGK